MSAPVRLLVCVNCGAEGIGAINGRHFCAKTACIDAVVSGTVRPVVEAMERYNAAVDDRLAARPAPEEKR